MTFDIANFSVPNMLRCSREIRRTATSCATMEDAANSVVRYLYEIFVDPSSGDRACALVRFYKTHAFGLLEPDTRQFARGQLGTTPPDDAMKCLTLLATIGEEPAWCDRRRSRGHQAIPLPSAEIVEQAPMIAQLVKQLGLDISALVQPSAPILSRQLEKRSYNVFHVETAAGSPYIPAQEFVERYGIRSVIGFGGLLRTGDLFSVILFSRVHVDADSAERFRNVSLDVKYALFSFRDEEVFARRKAPLA